MAKKGGIIRTIYFGDKDVKLLEAADAYVNESRGSLNFSKMMLVGLEMYLRGAGRV